MKDFWVRPKLDGVDFKHISHDDNCMLIEEFGVRSLKSYLGVW